MTHARPPHRRALLAIAATAVAVLAVAAVAGAGVITGPQSPAVQASNHLCGTSHDALDSQELEFLDHLRDWRAANNYQIADLEVSGALNSAAAWFAQHLVENGPAGPTGHHDHYERTQGQRALDCGYPSPYASVAGEGTFYLAAGQPFSVTPYEAVYGGSVFGFDHDGVTYPGSGAGSRGPASHPWPVKCVGAGRYQNASGTAHAWIVVIAQYPAGEACPGSTASPPPTATPSASPTMPATATPSPTATVEPTATPGPTQEPSSPARYVPALSREVVW